MTPFTTTLSPGELVIVPYPFTGGTGGRTRPALVLLDAGDADVLLARVTTRPPRDAHDVVIADWQGAGLRAPSTVRLHKLATSLKQSVLARLGVLQPADHAQVSAVLRRMFGNW